MPSRGKRFCIFATTWLFTTQNESSSSARSMIISTDTVIYMAPEGYQGDVFSQVSNLAGIEPLLALSAASDYRVALKTVWEEITHITGLYCLFVSESMANALVAAIPSVRIEDLVISDAPEADKYPLRSFVHPPSDLAEMQAATGQAP